MAEVCSTEKEEQFLSVYFNSLAQSSFDKAKDFVVSRQFKVYSFILVNECLFLG